MHDFRTPLIFYILDQIWKKTSCQNVSVLMFPSKYSLHVELCVYWTTPIVLLSMFECYKPFPVHWWLSVCLIHQFRMCICICVCVTLSEWTITKNPLNSCCSLCLPPSVSTQSPNFTSRCSDAGFGCPSTSSLIPTCHFVRFNAGVSCHSCQCTAASYLTHFFHTTGAYVPRRLMRYTFTSYLISASPRRSEVQKQSTSKVCAILPQQSIWWPKRKCQKFV